MTLSDRFVDYLRHFDHTRPIRDLHRDRTAKSMIGLRHDIDHSIDIALEAAYWEHQLGIRATYFVLHTAPYWNDPALIDKCLQLQDYGHEVGLHLNVLAEWARADVADPAARIYQLLDFLRGGGIEIIGISSHGDPLCYKVGFINYWCFRELRPTNPGVTEHMRTAEGVRDPSGAMGVPYPASQCLKRPDGSVFPLWSLSLREFDLAYHAWHVPFDRYYSDSGGHWSRSPDPLAQQVSKGRIQVLMHPEHWTGPKRIYFFLSTARSGSRWLSELIEAATPVTARHEYILNQEFHDGQVAEKRTGPGFAALARSSAEAEPLVADAWTRIDAMPGDYAEVNVYLERFTDLLGRYFPTATFVHLHRDLADVIRSVVNRGWYDTPLDDRHPKVDIPNWDQLGQFEKACHYAADVNRRLLAFCPHRLDFARMTTDPGYLAAALSGIGIPVHERLARPLFGRVVNANPVDDFPSYEAWRPEHRAIFERICELVAGRLNQSRRASCDGTLTPGWLPDLVRRTKAWLLRAFGFWNEQDLARGPIRPSDARRWFLHGCQVVQTDQNGAVKIKTNGAGHNGYVTFGGSTWKQLSSNGNRSSGWRAVPYSYVTGSIGVALPSGGRLVVFGLSYDRKGQKIGQRRLTVLDSGRDIGAFAFTARADSAKIDIALYFSGRDVPDSIGVRSFALKRRPLPVSTRGG
ncbi:MAG: hypothetical protein O7H40_09290 [Gammaproteobacteria bacterium]|nr:hypothetical protein [Gammaproteobacteria bacterium]